MGEAIIFVFVSWLTASIFIGLGIYALKRETPMHFWSGTTVKEEEISDVKAYNKANGFMWIGYGMLFIIAGIVALILGESIGSIILGLACFPGLFILIFIYLRIKKRYEVK